MTFLCMFLPIFLAVYFISKNITYKNTVLVAFSLLFYAWGEPVWVLAMLLSGLTDYVCGIVIDKYPDPKHKKIAMGASLVINLGMLSLFKYSGFFVENLNALWHSHIPVPRFNLPLGISFYTFQTLSYTIDMYKGTIKVQKNFLSFMCYVSMFPQLVAGPIVRYSDIEGDLIDRKVSVKNFSAGITRFSVGLAKKVLLANPAGAAATMLLSDPAKMTTASAWLGAVLYGFQVYFDFSGYSDMAIGMGKMVGFKFLENFNYPYEAKSVTDFWRRWHISLSTFFRDYVYIPMGGNRRLQFRNIALVWILTGFWHGASWNFILWGAYFGALLLLERYALRKVLDKIPSIISRIYTLFAVVISWGLFYYTDMSAMKQFFKALLFIDTPLSSFLPESLFLGRLWLLVALVLASTSLPRNIFKNLPRLYPKLRFAEPFYASVCIFLSFLMLLGQTYNPFLYFRF